MVHGQIGVLKISELTPMVQRRDLYSLGAVAHHMLVRPGTYPLFGQGVVDEEVYACPDVSTLKVTQGGRVIDAHSSIPKVGYAILTWSEHEVATTVMMHWRNIACNHPVWDFALDLAMVRPEYEYDHVNIYVDEHHTETVEYRRGVLLPPL